MGTQSPTYGREKRKTPYNCQKLKKKKKKKVIAYQNKNHIFNWLNTLHVTFTIPRYRLEC